MTSSQGNHTINTSVQLTSNLNAIITTGTFTVNGVVSGTGDLTKSGAGALALTATNSYTGNTSVQMGTLRISNRYLADTADVLLSSGATLNLQFSGSADAIGSLLIDNISQVIGVWGAIGNGGATYHTPLITGTGLLQVAAGPVAGDYNNDGVVNGSDYITWRRQLGAASITNRDPNNTGAVGQGDFLSWRANFGQTTGSGVGSSLGLNVANGRASPNHLRSRCSHLPQRFYSHCTVVRTGGSQTTRIAKRYSLHRCRQKHGCVKLFLLNKACGCADGVKLTRIPHSQ